MTDEAPRNELVPTKVSSVGMSTFGAGGAIPALRNLEDVVTIASLMARSGIGVRKHLRDNPGACFGVTMFALEINANPYAIANKSYLVNDQIAYEAQVLAAVINKRAPIKGRPVYTFDGEGPTRRCTVTVITNDDEPQTLTYTSPMFKDIKTKNSPLWVADVDQQFCYFSIRSLTRRYFPETILGMYDREELEAEPMTEQAPGAASGIRERLKGGSAGGQGFSQGGVEAATAADPSTIADAVFEEGALETTVEPEPDPAKRQAVREGAATEGEVYILADAPLEAGGKVQTYKDGEKYSKIAVKGQGKYAVYAAHPGKAAEPEEEFEVEILTDAPQPGQGEDMLDLDGSAEDAPAAEEQPAAAAPPTEPQAAEPPPPAAEEPQDEAPITPLGQMKAATAWLGEGGIRSIYAKLTAEDVFKQADEDDQNDIRAAVSGEIDRVRRDHGEKVSQETDATVFTIWMCAQEGQGGLEAIDTAYRALKRTSVYETLTQPQKDAIDQRVQRRVARIGTTIG